MSYPANTNSTVNSSSLIDLKAVVFNKSSQVKNAKATGVAPAKTDLRSKKKALWAKRNTGVDKRNERDKETVVSMEEEDMLAKSKAKLQQKAALYDKLSSTTHVPVDHQDDEENGFLVDFEKKSYDEAERKSAARLDEDAHSAEQPDDWVDYIDSLGRSRRCLRKDLSDLQAMDAALAGKRQEEESTKVDEPEAKKPASSSLPWLREDATLVSEDMYRELRRQKWEEQERGLAGRDGPVHYEDIRFDEVRDMGVGYYQFSTDETERQEQMELLEALRNQTMEQRKRHQHVKDRRQIALEARLQKVKARRAKRQGIEVAAEEGEIDATEEVKQGIQQRKDQQLAEKEVAMKAAEELAESRRLEEERRAAATLEWERGQGDMGATGPGRQESDDDRDEEFAPPSVYSSRPAAAASRGRGNHSKSANQDLTAKAKMVRPFAAVLKNCTGGQSNAQVSDSSASEEKEKETVTEPCQPGCDASPLSQSMGSGVVPATEGPRSVTSQPTLPPISYQSNTQQHPGVSSASSTSASHTMQLPAVSAGNSGYVHQLGPVYPVQHNQYQHSTLVTQPLPYTNPSLQLYPYPSQPMPPPAIPPQAMSHQAVSSQPVPPQPWPHQAMSSQPVPPQPMPHHAVSSQPLPPQPMPHQSMLPQPMPGYNSSNPYPSKDPNSLQRPSSYPGQHPHQNSFPHPGQSPNPINFPPPLQSSGPSTLSYPGPGQSPNPGTFPHSSPSPNPANPAPPASDPDLPSYLPPPGTALPGPLPLPPSASRRSATQVSSAAASREREQYVQKAVEDFLADCR